jgi:tagatose 6-phosphate kinase
VLARHGHAVLAAGFAGGHSGAWLAELVAAAGMESLLTPTAAPLRIGLMAAAPAAAPTTLLAQGFAVSAAEAAAAVAAIGARLSSCALLILSGSVPDPALAADFYPALLAAAAAAGVPAWLDSYGPAATAALSSAHPPALGKPNAEEYASTPGWERCPEVHRSDGAAGVTVLLHGKPAWRVTPPAVQEVKAIGSGDCYLAALAHGRLLGWEMPRTLAYAAAAGALNAASPAVAELDPAAITALAAQTRVERLP